MADAPADSDALARQLAEAGADILPRLEELLPRGLDDYLSAAVWHHLDTGGKRIRPALCLLACRHFGGEPARATWFAVAVELLHNMFLVHDDVEDGDTMRRDRETVWVRFGTPNAINVGDYLLAAAYRAVLRSPVDAATTVRLLDEFTETYATTCRGQALDINMRARPDLSIEDYLRMVSLKTGRYLALGMVGGAIIAGSGDVLIERLRALAASMGAAFQIRDDLIDLTAGKGRGGVVGCDIREGKPSILYAHALGAAGADDRRALVEIMGRPREEVTDDDVRRARDVYDRCGSVAFAAAEADRLVGEALRTIDEIPPAAADGAARDFLRGVTAYMVSRTK